MESAASKLSIRTTLVAASEWKRMVGVSNKVASEWKYNVGVSDKVAIKMKYKVGVSDKVASKWKHKVDVLNMINLRKTPAALRFYTDKARGLCWFRFR